MSISTTQPARSRSDEGRMPQLRLSGEKAIDLFKEKSTALQPTTSTKTTHDNPRTRDTPDEALRDWSALHGIDPHTGLIISSTLLAHLAADSLSFNGLPGIPGSILPSLAISESDSRIRGAIRNLVEGLLRVQTGLMQFTHEFRQDEINRMMFRIRNSHADNEVYRAMVKGTPESEELLDTADELLVSDLNAVKGTALRYEEISRPQMIMAGAMPKDLTTAAAHCHKGRGVLAGCLEMLPGDSVKRAARIEQLSRLIEGEESPIPPQRTESHIKREVLVLGGIIGFPARDYPRLFSENRDFLARLIPVASTTRPGFDENPESGGADAFIKQFNRIANRIIARRRRQYQIDSGLKDQAARAEFFRRRAQYLSKLDGHPIAANSPGVASLPALALWGWAQLAGQKLPDELIVSMAFECAEHIRDTAHRMFTLHDQQADALLHMKTANAIVRKLGEKSKALTHLELVRSFHKQSSSIYELPLQVLLERGIVTRDATNRYELTGESAASLRIEDFITTDLP